MRIFVWCFGWLKKIKPNKQMLHRFWILCLIAVLVGCGEHEVVENFAELAAEPLSEEALLAWESVPEGMNVAWGNIDIQYLRDEAPRAELSDKCRISGWRGERVSAQILVWTKSDLKGVECRARRLKAKGASLPASAVSARFVRYTLADEQTFRFEKSGNSYLAPDMLDTLPRFDIAGYTTRPVWLTIDIPQDAKAGIYRGEIVVRGSDARRVIMPYELEVFDHTLAPASEWAYHLDLWQHPSAVARAYDVELWSDEHFMAMKPLMQMLADAGQKVITATLNKDPWNHQCYDGYEAMIRWIKHTDGSWSYDYRVFDRWVEFMLGLGIDKMINCYSMVPWNCELEYFDEKQGRVLTVEAKPSTPLFDEMWGPFLADFKQHLEAKGWLGITNIAMDERSAEDMDAAVAVLNRYAPELNFALADNHKSYKRYTMMRDVCVAMYQKADKNDIEKRREQGDNTTFYVCCVPSYPNTFTCSEPFEAEMLGWHCAAAGYDGMLRWAYNSWPEQPHIDSRFGTWKSGDTFLVYPGACSSVRFERLRDGVEVVEKIRHLRNLGVDIRPVEQALEQILSNNAHDHTLPWRATIAEARAALDEVSRHKGL